MTKMAGSGYASGYAWIRGSGSTPKCHGSGKLVVCDHGDRRFLNFLADICEKTYFFLKVKPPKNDAQAPRETRSRELLKHEIFYILGIILACLNTRIRVRIRNAQ
jgi:hypothetical protein